MAIKVKDVATSATKWQNNAGRAAESYAIEAVAAAETWARNAAGAEDNWKQSIQAPNVSVRFRRGVQKAGAAKYSRKISEVGKDRFAPGVAAAIDDFRSGVEPYLSTIAAITLSARKPRGDPSNLKRVEEISKTLNAKRLAMLAAGA